MNLFRMLVSLKLSFGIGPMVSIRMLASLKLWFSLSASRVLDLVASENFQTMTHSSSRRVGCTINFNNLM